MALKYTVTSTRENSKGGKQITVTIGEGSNKRSHTRHLHRQGGALIGLNIDERAIPLNERYEQELAEAKSKLASAEAALDGLKKKLEVIEGVEPHDAVETLGVDAAKAMIKAMIEIIMVEVTTAEEHFIDAKAKLDIVRRDLPLLLEFHGPGLTL